MADKVPNDNPAGLFIPAGVLTGMGVGFLTDNFLAGMFIGLGIGFALFAVLSVLTQNRAK